MSPKLRGAGLALLHLAFLAVIGVHVAIPFLLPEDHRSDFGLFYLSVIEARRDGDPYTTRVEDPYGASGRVRDVRMVGARDTPKLVGTLNSPFQIALLTPLARLEYGAAMWIWYGLGLAAGILGAFLMARTWLPDRPLAVWGPALGIAVLLFFPSLANAWLAQFGLFLTLITACTFWLLSRGRVGAAAAVLGVAAALKVFVGLFGVLFLLTRRWRALAAFGVSFTVSVLVGGVVLGWHTYVRYVDILGQVMWYPASWNASVFGSVTRLVGYRASGGVVLDLPALGLPLARGVALALGAGYVLLLLHLAAGRGRRRGNDGTTQPRTETGSWRSAPFVLLVSLTFVLMILLSPLGWLYYFPALIPSCAALLAATRPGRERSATLLGVGAFIALSSVPQSLYPGNEFSAEGYDWWKAELPVAGLLVLTALHVFLLLRTRRGESGTLA